MNPASKLDQTNELEKQFVQSQLMIIDTHVSHRWQCTNVDKRQENQNEDFASLANEVGKFVAECSYHGFESAEC